MKFVSTFIALLILAVTVSQSKLCTIFALILLIYGL